MKKRFSFIYPVTQGRVDLKRIGAWRYDHVADLVVTGTSVEKSRNTLEKPDDRFDFDIEEILFEGVNIFPILDAMDSLDKIEAACFHHIHHLSMGEESDFNIYEPKQGSLARVISLPLKRKIR